MADREKVAREALEEAYRRGFCDSFLIYDVGSDEDPDDDEIDGAWISATMQEWFAHFLALLDEPQGEPVGRVKDTAPCLTGGRIFSFFVRDPQIHKSIQRGDPVYLSPPKPQEVVDDEGRDAGFVETGALTIAMTEQGDIGIWRDTEDGDDSEIIGFGKTVQEAWAMALTYATQEEE